MNTEHFFAVKRPHTDTAANGEDPRDLGLGSVAEGIGQHRLLNHDGTFNVRRKGRGWSQENTLYHAALTLSWPKFFGVLTLAYFLFNLFFGGLFWLWGDTAIDGALDLPGGRFAKDFFFSVQTFAIIRRSRLVSSLRASHVRARQSSSATRP